MLKTDKTLCIVLKTERTVCVCIAGKWRVVDMQPSRGLCRLVQRPDDGSYQHITLRYVVPACTGCCTVDIARTEQYKDTAALDSCFSQHFAVPCDHHSTNILHSCNYLSLKLYRRAVDKSLNKALKNSVLGRQDVRSCD